ncbi:MAG: hypothetical protein DSO01_06675 [Archaeoglobi archaeon]|nr:MAG: hypothetical protein DSO01_06675 [Archaeoglobi archaeon]
MTKSKEEFEGKIQKIEQEQALVESEQARAEMEVKSQIMLARKFPRNETMIRDKILQACKRRTFAQKALYSYPRGGTQIIGPSINLAKELARLWGNLIYGMMIVEDTDETRTIRGLAWDLETNTREFDDISFKKLVQRKGQGWIVPDERDLRELTNRHGSILKRNAILNLLPADLIQEAVETCQKALSKVRPEAILKAFESLNVDKKTLEAYLGHPIEETNENERAQLQGIYNAIKDGQVKPEEIFNTGNKNQELIQAEVKESLFEETKNG